MRLLNPPTLGLAPLFGRLDYPAHSLTLIAKASVALQPGGVCELRSGAPVLPSGDVPYRDGQGGPRYESDFVPCKAAADVLVVGHYHAPDGGRVHADAIQVDVDRRSAKLAVIGKRSWNGYGPLPGVREAEPFSKLELRWEYAFGGPTHPANPAGRGHPAQPVDDDRPLALPRIERPDQPYQRADEPPAPACFAPMSRTWPARRRLAGTYDDRWQRTRWPWLAEDCDPEYFQAAAPELRFRGYLRGDERLQIVGMHPVHRAFVTRLPGLRVAAAVQRVATGVCDDIPMQLDTLWIDMDAELACLVWRGSCQVADADASDIAYAWADFEPVAVGSRSEGVARAERAIREDEEQWHWHPASAPLPDEPSAPPSADGDDDEPWLPAELTELLASLPAPPTYESPEGSARVDGVTEDAQAHAKLDALEVALTEEENGTGPLPFPWTRDRVRAARERGESLAGLDLSGIDLRAEDLSGLDLSGTLLIRARLDGASFRGANLQGATLEGASLDATDLSEACLQRATLSGARGAKICARRADLSQANLSECDWPEACCEAANLTQVLARRARLPRATFAKARLAEADFEEASLAGVVLDRTEAPASRWVRASLAGARLESCSLAEADFSEADLRGTVVQACDLHEVSLESASLSGTKWVDCRAEQLRAATADFSRAELVRVTAEQAIFSDGKLVDATFEGCQLPRVDASAADFTGASLRGCGLRGGVFARANFERSRVLGCDCFEACLEGARLIECDGSGSSFFRAEFFGAITTSFGGSQRDLHGTKLMQREDED